ncbi:MAG: hypothetical protein IJK77_00605 [Lachnospiraceae bacterium]|nr:hypothetical protein [Lachnospiraceae bacterium]
MDKDKLQELFDKYCRKLRITPQWDVKLELVDDPAWTKTGDFKIDCDDRKAVLMLNVRNPRQENPEEVIVHELMHLKLYPLDQVTESLISSQFEEGTPASDFAYTQFFTALEQTVEELTKCFLLEFGENRELSYGRCRGMKSFNELYDGLKSID